MRQILMSIRPKYSAKIFAGEKHFELRRMRVRASAGDVVWVYESAPTMALVGAFTVRRVLFESLRTIWKHHSQVLGVSYEEYVAYFRDRDVGCAIEVDAVARFTPISLTDLRQRVEGFRPPQSYQWCDSALTRALPARTLRGFRSRSASGSETFGMQ